MNFVIGFFDFPTLQDIGLGIARQYYDFMCAWWYHAT